MAPVIDGAEVTPEELARARRYPMTIAWSDEDELFLASFPDVPGIVTHGATPEEAAEHGEEVIVIWLTSLLDSGYEIPKPSLTAHRISVRRPPNQTAERIARIRHKLDVSQQVFADMLNVSAGTVRSWEQGIRRPHGASLRLLDIAEHYPSALISAAAIRRPTGTGGKACR
jgi:putative transcriptional regulator